MEEPTSEGIHFSLRKNNWLDGIARAMQEALARLCGQSINQIKGTLFEYYARRDAMGQPLEVPGHAELKHQVDHLDFMLYDRQKELDNASAYANHNYAIAVKKDQNLAILVKEHRSLCRLRDKKDHIIARLRHKVSDLEETIHEQDMQLEERENEGEDIHGDPYSYLSDDDDYLEDLDMDFHTNDDDSAFIDDEEATGSDE